MCTYMKTHTLLQDDMSRENETPFETLEYVRFVLTFGDNMQKDCDSLIVMTISYFPLKLFSSIYSTYFYPEILFIQAW